MNTIKLPFGSGMQLGMGIDVVSSAIRGQPFVFSSLDVTNKTEYVKTHRIRSLISSTAEYEHNVSASAEIEGKGLGWSASASVQYLKNSVSDSRSLVFFDKVTTVSKGVGINDPAKWKLSPEAIKLLKSGRDAFTQAYGTHFVGDIWSGGSFLATLSVQTDSEKDATSVGVQLRGSYDEAILNVNAQADFAQKVSSLTTKATINASSFVEGGGVTEYTLGDLKQMMATADSFATGASTMPTKELFIVPYAWDILLEVKEILGADASAETIPEQVLDTITDSMLEADYMISDIQGRLRNGQYCGAEQESKLKSLVDSVRAKQQSVNNLTVRALSQLTVENASNLISVQSERHALNDIDTGPCTIVCEFVLLPGWTWDQLAPAFVTPGLKTEISLLPEDVFKPLGAAVLPNVTYAYFFVKYLRVNENNLPDPSGKGMLVARVDARNSWLQDGNAAFAPLGVSDSSNGAAGGPNPPPDGKSGGVYLRAYFK